MHPYVVEPKCDLFEILPYVVPLNVFSLVIPNEDLIMCNSELAKEYEKNGYKLIEIRKKEPNESILSRRLERRDGYDRY